MPKRTERSLTAAFCRSAKPAVRATDHGPEAARCAYPDNDVRGLELRVSASGEKTWAFRYRDRVTGRQGRVTLGTFDPMTDDPDPVGGGPRRLTLQGARVTARRLRAKVDDGADPAAERRQARSQAQAQTVKTMADLADAYFEACEAGAHRGRRRRKAASTIANERWLWGRYLARRLGAERVEAVNKAGVRAVLRAILADAPIQSNRCRALLSQLFNFAIAEERVGANPVALVPPMAEEAARTRTLTDAELVQVWTGLQDPSALETGRGGRPVLIGRAVAIAMELAMLTLQRRSEVAGMLRAELDLDHAVWVIAPQRTKGRAEHLVPLTPRAVALIREALALQADRAKGPGAAVFPSPRSRDAAIGGGALSHAMAHLTAALGLQDVTLHDLRRTGATGMAALGVPPFVVSKVLAHKDSGGGAAVTARHYNLYAYAEEKRDALGSWEERLRRLLGFAREGGDS